MFKEAALNGLVREREGEKERGREREGRTNNMERSGITEKVRLGKTGGIGGERVEIM